MREREQGGEEHEGRADEARVRVLSLSVNATGDERGQEPAGELDDGDAVEAEPGGRGR